jgi:predicted deacylase
MIPFAERADGSLEHYPLIVIKGKQEGPTAVITGGIHGDEYEGPAALFDLTKLVDPRQLKGNIVVVPIANLAAFSAGKRTSPVDLQNLARVFPGDPAGTLSSRLAHHLLNNVATKGDFLIDCHSGGIRLAFLDVAGFYTAEPDISPALADRSSSLARNAGLAYVWKLPPRAGVLSYETIRRGIPAIGIEIGGRGGLLARDREKYLFGFLRILAANGMMPASSLPPAPIYSSYLEGDFALASVGGFIETHVELGEHVRKGRLLATISSPLGEIRAEMRAGTAGLVMAVRHLCSIEPGEWAICVVEERPL